MDERTFPIRSPADWQSAIVDSSLTSQSSMKLVSSVRSTDSRNFWLEKSERLAKFKPSNCTPFKTARDSKWFRNSRLLPKETTILVTIENLCKLEKWCHISACIQIGNLISIDRSLDPEIQISYSELPWAAENSKLLRERLGFTNCEFL